MYDPTEQDYFDLFEDYPEPTAEELEEQYRDCLLNTSPSPRDGLL